MGANATLTFYSFIVQVFCIRYMVATVGLPAKSALAVTAAAYLAAAILSPLWGMVCDRVGAQKVYMAGAAFSLFYAPVLFYLLDRGNVWLAAFAVAIALGVGLSAQFAAQATFLIGLFPVGIRFSGIAISREVTGALLAGPGPAVAALLVARDHGHWGLLAAALATSSAIVIVSLLCARRLAATPEPAA
jgi:MFS family permease